MIRLCSYLLRTVMPRPPDRYFVGTVLLYGTLRCPLQDRPSEEVSFVHAPIMIQHHSTRSRESRRLLVQTAISKQTNLND